ncbi:DUF262 domain-containing protein [Aerococcus agrisoli]|uniref:DUF262 domain-containing protein n=1 Tax=Aerococcus agrisoli TaxID=2487350 RepID=A0A3N4GGH8_9LACT|nr:DUF262 domain-containing protein [Aerococcus agrisoli]RPA60507.1 DUF262 domain-containing protein [Aerococcus agrisoli]
MVNKYRVETMMYSELQQNATVPTFQRKLVWSQKEKKSFIKTLSQGYPFGAILIYKYKDKTEFSIIDGLQRFTTIQDYVENPEKYIDFSEIVESMLSEFGEPSWPESTKEKNKRDYATVIEKFVKQSSHSDNSTSTLFELLEEQITGFSDNIQSITDYQKLEVYTHQIKDKVKNNLNVENLPIPTIIFTGAVEELATVFENLNRGGKKLSKYQVFAAQWSKHEIKLSDTPLNKRILEITIQRYETLIEDRKVEINNFSREDMEEEKTINVSELCYAFGYLILEKMSVFWDKDNEDQANQIGYSTLTMLFGIKNKDMTKLVTYFDRFENSEFIEKFVESALEIFREINDRFAKVFKVPGLENDKYYGGSTATNFQLLSFFGSLWGLKYENLQSGKLITKQKYKVNYKTVQQNMIKYFIYDTVIGRWSGTGDTRMDEITISGENYYLRDLERNQFEQALLNWHDEIVAKNSINFEPVSKMLYTVLSSYYDQYYKADKYDSEHVIARKYLNSIRNETNYPIPGGSIGNHMYLDKWNNRSKQEYSLYDATKPGYELKEDFLTYQIYPTKTEFGEIKLELERKNGDYSQIRTTITNRGRDLINDLIQKLYD